ncbi:hypothetical protein FRB99_001403 [Tulasnella sp. 403]|nr:hypothetical protein FRB99_001403 [Tulasnella sp. 403]
MTGPDGSQGGLGTRDSINSGPQLSGLVKIERPTPSVTTPSDEPAMAAPKDDEPQDTDMELEPLDEDTRALKALLEGTESKSADEVAAIPMDEAAALQRDLVDLPDEATAEGYARVPVEQFGAAMLRGMGWKPPAKGEDEPWVPGQRPALLGLGAKPRAAPEGSEDKSKRPSWMSKQKDRRYVPVVKQERGDDRGSGYSSRASSRSRSPPPFRTSHSDNRATHSSRSDRDREREKDRDRDRERDRQYRNRDDKSDRDRDHRRDRDRDRRGDRDSDRERDRRDRR